MNTRYKSYYILSYTHYTPSCTSGCILSYSHYTPSCTSSCILTYNDSTRGRGNRPYSRA